jgi:hypothetical protein
MEYYFNKASLLFEQHAEIQTNNYAKTYDELQTQILADPNGLVRLSRIQTEELLSGDKTIREIFDVKTLDELKTEKRKEIIDDFTTASIYTHGTLINGQSITLTGNNIGIDGQPVFERMKDLAIIAKNANQTLDTYYIKDNSGTIHLLTKSELLDFAASFEPFMLSHIYKKEQLITAINAASTKEEVSAIAW